ncbi:MAG: hypothetical protein BMS9Abin20_0337 [Acidimicrobiia bacterium]|nr:MAG: hypothetical protein BMS9Abin20_0337 [Acidimicrobiia bacterium]
MTSLAGLALPIDWTTFGWPVTPRFGDVTCSTGDPKWAWDGSAPAFAIPTFELPEGLPVDSFTVDHVVLLVPSLDEAIATLSQAGCEPRLRMAVQGRPAAFFRVGPVLEVIESPVRHASIYGLALATDTSLEALALEWRSRNLHVGDVKSAIQPGRQIVTVHGLDAGFAVMSGDRAVGGGP